MTAPTPATTGTARIALYWRCPACNARVLGYLGLPWALWPAWKLQRIEGAVEAHEAARHGIGAA